MAEDNTEIFIDSVNRFPCLYDPQNEDYKDIEVKRNAWTEVIKVTGLKDETVEESINILNEHKLNLEEYIVANGFSSPEECLRPCQNGRTKKCYFRFHLEQYPILGKACEICTPNRTNDCQCIIADAVERIAYTINRKLPGPAIEVCQRDSVIIDVINLIPASAVTIHWHGMLQHDTQFYDGVPYVTQCPIQPGTTFRYKWRANYPGSHFYHSHTGLQKVDGLAGPLIVRQPRSRTPSSSLYDYDLSAHVIFIQDWLYEYMDERFPGRIHSNKGQTPTNILINGKGPSLNRATGTYTNVPYEVFEVSPNLRYRFRLINAFGGTCPAQITIQAHSMIVLTTDGHPIVPVKVDSIICASAERFDFIVETNNTKGAFWVHVKALEGCSLSKLDQVAILRYSNGPDYPGTPRPKYDISFPVQKVLNPLDTNCAYTRDDAICINQLKYDGVVDADIFKSKVEKIFLPFRIGFHTPQNFYKPGVYEKYYIVGGSLIGTGLIDNIAYKSPPSPLLTQYSDLDSSDFCNADQEIQNCGVVCRCTHIIEVDYNSIVELILLDAVHANGVHHPFHLHGFAFHVMAIGKMPEKGNGTLEDAIYLDKKDYFDRRYDNPPLKDTIMIPSNGYVVLRFRADNRGFWLLHCHFLYHLLTGMQAILKVGKVKDMPDPPYGFPKCGDYLPYA